MADIEKIQDQQLVNTAGGMNAGRWVTVGGLQTGYLAMRTQPRYDFDNEIRGSESYNGQALQVTGSYVTGSDGRTYVWVYNPRTGVSGWVNAAFVY